MMKTEILLVEDNESDARLIKEAFKEANVECIINVVSDGALAIDYLFQKGKYSSVKRPDAVLLDLKLPKKNGIEVLKEIRQGQNLQELPILMLTNSDSSDDIIESYASLVNSYVTKPLVMSELVELVKYVYDMWLSKLDNK